MTDDIRIAPVMSRRDIERFLDVPRRVYRDDPNWVPPLRQEMRKLLDRKRNPFFEHGEAAYWIARRGDEPVGRISAQVNRLHLDRYGDGTGNFGCFEAVDDPAVFHALLRTAEDWLTQRGMTRVLGPYSLTVNDEIGVLLSGFETPPMLMMPHSPRYYARGLEAAGYRKAKDLHAYKVDVDGRLQAHVKRVETAAARLRAEGRLTVRNLDKRRFKEDMRLALEIYNDAWRDNWGFLPVTEREAEALIEAVAPIVKPEGVVFGLIDGKIEAFLVGLPNLNEIIADLDGRLLPFGWAKLLWRLKRSPPKSARIVLAGVRMAYRNSPVSAALVTLLLSEIIKAGMALGIEQVELSWILEDNGPSQALCRSIGSLSKVYRLYQHDLGPGAA
jgi:hypothetical protein